jgi:hypothetical protein
MRKLLHLVFAVWKTNRPFDTKHFAWEQPSDTPPTTTTLTSNDVPSASNDKAVGHKRDEPAKQEVVTTATATVVPGPAPVNPAPATPSKRPKVDYAFLRQQGTMQQVLEHLGLLGNLRGRGQQRRGPCPIHGQPNDPQHTFSVHLGRNIFQCFHADCGAHGNVLDLWMAVRHLPLYEAALDLAATFSLPRNREEEPVGGTR